MRLTSKRKGGKKEQKTTAGKKTDCKRKEK